MSQLVLDLSALDDMPADEVRELLHPACASDIWLEEVTASGPYRDLDALWAVSDRAIDSMPWSAVGQALDAHPRIGRRPSGADLESTWSREEQAGAATAPQDVATALHRGNVDYERRFGTVFLICATGRAPEQILAALGERLDNEPDVERQVVRRELAAIVRLRLARIFTR